MRFNRYIRPVPEQDFLTIVVPGKLRLAVCARMVRITSYNVCYTKLLRMPAQDLEIVATGQQPRGPGEALRQVASDAVP